MKRRLMLLFSLLALVCVCFSLSLVSFAISESTIDAQQFTMKEGASVRLVEGESGIRFSTQISPEFYEQIQAKDAEWHTLIAPNVTASSLSVSTPLVMDVYKDYFTQQKITPTEIKSNGVVTHYEYNTCIIYDNVDYTDVQRTKLYNLVLTARSYVTFTENEQVNVIYADASVDTTRSIKQVAEQALDYYKNNEKDGVDYTTVYTILNKYAESDENSGEQTPPLVNIQSDKLLYTNEVKTNGEYSLQVEVGELPFSPTKISLEDNQLLNATFSEGIVEIPTALDGYSLGNDYALNLIDEQGNSYTSKIRLVTGLIKTEQEFFSAVKRYTTGENKNGNDASVTQKFARPNLSQNDPSFYGVDQNGKGIFRQRYYMLDNDVTLTSSDSMEHYRFYDVIDGNGYTLTVNQTPAYGIFGYGLGGSAQIKNLKIIIKDVFNQVVNGDTAYPSTLICNNSYEDTRLENLFIQVVPDQVVSLVEFAGITYAPAQDSVVNNLYLYLSDNVKDGSKKDDYGTLLNNQSMSSALVGNMGAGLTSTSGYDNVFVVSKNFIYLSDYKKNDYYYIRHFADTDLALFSNEYYVEKIYLHDDTIFRYDSKQQLIANGNVTQIGNWDIDTEKFIK